MVVKVLARAAIKSDRRYIVVKLGYALCEKAKFLQKEHRVQIMLGDGADAGKVAVTMDDAAGKFAAKRRTDGRYEISISGHAAAGKFATTFPPFERTGSIQILPGLPPVIVFDAPAEFLSYG